MHGDGGQTDPMSDAARYGDSFADVYDDWYGDMFDTDGAVRALLALAEDPRRGVIVELGVGTGRLAIPLAAAHPVIGIDASQAMLDRLLAKDPPPGLTPMLGDMADVAHLVSDPVALVVCAFNTFLNLSTADAQQRCIDGVAHLLDDGFFVVEAFVPVAADEIVRHSTDRASVRSDVPVFTRTSIDVDAQTIEGMHLEVRDGVTIERPWRARYLTVDQFDRLAAASGLALVERWSSWRGAPFDDDSTSHISIYARTHRSA